MENRTTETIFGFVIIMVVAVFCLYALFISNVFFSKTYKINAVFRSIGPLNVGAKIIVSGYEVGKVDGIVLDTDNYNVIVSMEIKNDVLIPKDSTIELFSSGVFDAIGIKILPGKSKEYFANNYTTNNTKDYLSLEDRIGNIFLNLDNK